MVKLQSYEFSAATGETVPDAMHLDIPNPNELTLSYGCGDLLMVFNDPPDRPMIPYVFSLSEQTAYPVLLSLQKDAFDEMRTVDCTDGKQIFSRSFLHSRTFFCRLSHFYRQ